MLHGPHQARCMSMTTSLLFSAEVISQNCSGDSILKIICFCGLGGIKLNLLLIFIFFHFLISKQTFNFKITILNLLIHSRIHFLPLLFSRSRIIIIVSLYQWIQTTHINRRILLRNISYFNIRHLSIWHLNLRHWV